VNLLTTAKKYNFIIAVLIPLLALGMQRLLWGYIQLGGTLNISGTDGTEFNITFVGEKV
jgi:hypothetical protein